MDSIPGTDTAEDTDRQEHVRLKQKLRASGVELSEPGLLKGLLHTDPVVRQHAATLLGSDGSLDSVSGLVEAMKDDDAMVRIEAGRALEAVVRTEARTVARRELANRERAEIAIFAAGVLADLGDPSGYPLVYEAVRGEELYLRSASLPVLESFVPLGGRRVGDHIIDIESDYRHLLKSETDETLRAAAAYHLGRVATPAAIEVLEAEARQSYPSAVRDAIGNALAMARSKSEGA